MIIDFASLASGAVVVFLAKNPMGFRLAVVVGLVLAMFFWYACYAYTRLWNKRFRLKLAHHAACSIAALIALLFSIIYPSLTYVRGASEASISAWELAVRRDATWAATTYRDAYQAVHRLGLEDFRGAPPPGSPGSWIPTTSDKSREEAATIYVSAACTHFATSRPFLSKLVWPRPGVPTERVFADVHRWQQNNSALYPPERAIELAVEQVHRGLVAQVPLLLSRLRVSVIIMFLLAQAVPFGFVGWAAYRDIKVRG